MYLYAIDDVYMCIYQDDGSICHTKLLSIYLSSSSIAVFFLEGNEGGRNGGLFEIPYHNGGRMIWTMGRFFFRCIERNSLFV